MSIHFTSSTGTHSKGIGTETLIYSAKNADTAASITSAISKVSGLKSRGAKVRQDLGLLKGTNKPCYLIEVCFVNDSVDVAIYRRDFEKICQAIANELAKAVGKTLKPSTTITVEDKQRQRAIALIKKAVATKVFTSPHNDVDKYTDAQLFDYVMTYAERLTK